jgi:hypothetical protein
MAPKKKVERPQENVSLGPQVREGELVFGVARIFASFVSSMSTTFTSLEELTRAIE